MAEKFEKPVGFKNKVENYWYHYKWQTLGALFLIATIVICCVQCSKRENPDIVALLYIEQNVSDFTTEDLEYEIEKYMTDVNGDGEVICQVVNLSSSGGTGNYAIDKSQRLLSEVINGENFFYIVDKNGYDFFYNQDMDIFDSGDFCNQKGINGWNWDESEVQKAMEIHDLPDDMYFCVRKLYETNDSKKKRDTKAEIETVIENIANNNQIYTHVSPTDK